MPAAEKTSGSRQRFLDAAVRLFARHSVAGTSLQMIGDELGVTKAAVHHHFRSRQELMAAVVAPLCVQLTATVDAAATLRTAHARAEHALTGFVDTVLTHRQLLPILNGDPGARELLISNPQVGDLTARLTALLAAVEPGPGGRIRADIVLSGLACAAGQNHDLDHTALRRHLLDAGRRTLGLRTPRTSTP
ncbi:helix-turn-helix domain-containing protein [Actinoplanes sp. NPDC026670]|uniref:TetR/AcrR family transcriptional regulator n=1 Tax=Actinoplanes sp. NPDC026670 TaxID=3154700 RepID=UPI0033DE82A5